MQDGEGGEEIFMACDDGRGASGIGEPGDENAREVDTETGKSKHLAHAAHNVAIVLCAFAGALSDHPDARDAHRVRRNSDDTRPAPRACSGGES